MEICSPKSKHKTQDLILQSRSSQKQKNHRMGLIDTEDSLMMQQFNAQPETRQHDVLSQINSQITTRTKIKEIIKDKPKMKEAIDNFFDFYETLSQASVSRPARGT